MSNSSTVFRRLILDPAFEAELRDKPHKYLYSSDSKPFSFETVFYRTEYSYCCCPCAYQHEYFDYLSDKDEMEPQYRREMDEAVFEQIVQKIADRRCPHADKVESKYLTTSTVFTNHILAVCGSREQFSSWSSHTSSIFQLNLYVYIVLKNSCRILELDSDLWCNAKFMSPIRSKNNHDIVNWERLSLLECCARKRNIKVFQNVLMSLRPHIWQCNDLFTVYDLALKYEQREIIDTLIQNGFKTYADQERFYRGNHENRRSERLLGAEAAIVYNYTKILNHLLPKLARQLETSQKAKDKLFFICSALQRDECRKVFLKYGFQEHQNLTDHDQQGELFHILLNYPSHKKEIIPIIQQYKKIWLPFNGVSFDGILFCNDYQISLDCLLNQHCQRGINSVEFLQLITLGEEIDLTRLRMEHLDDIFREFVELCLYSNL